MSPSPRVEGHCGLPEVCRGRGPRASGPCHKARDSGPNEACQPRARGPGGREHGEDAHSPRTRSVARSVQDRVARRYLVESTSGVHASTSKEGVTGHFGTPMKETGGLSQPLRASIVQTKQNKSSIPLGRTQGAGGRVVRVAQGSRVKVEQGPGQAGRWRYLS